MLHQLKRKEYLMTDAERKTFNIINKKIDTNKYIVFPQISIKSLYYYDYTLPDNTEKMIIDFLICQKPFYKPKLVVELNDYTHELDSRIYRDKKLQNFLLESHTKFWILKNITNYNNFEKEIEIQIDKMLNFLDSFEIPEIEEIVLRDKYIKSQKEKIGFNINKY